MNPISIVSDIQINALVYEIFVSFHFLTIYSLENVVSGQWRKVISLDMLKKLEQMLVRTCSFYNLVYFVYVFFKSILK